MTAEMSAKCYMDPDTGFMMQPGTQRPDGSWRKPIRVREGYVPQDEVPLYESKGKAMAKAREGGFIPGLHVPDASQSSRMQHGSNFKIDTFVVPKPVTTIPGLSMTPSSSDFTTASTKKKKKKGGATQSDVKDLSAQLKKTSISEDRPRNEAGQPLATDPNKKLRNLKKKLRDIEALEEKLKSGEIENPEKEQLDKVKRKREVLREIDAIENALDS